MNDFDRRSAPRVAVCVTVQQHVEGETHCCTATNVSLSGLYMERPIGSFVRHSAEVQLEIPLPDGAEPLWARAEIVYDCFRAQFHGSAVRFKQMSVRDRSRLQTFLAPLEALGAAPPSALNAAVS